MLFEYLEKNKRRLERLKDRLVEFEKEHVGNELRLTYWAGYNMGNLKGMISEIEENIDTIEDMIKNDK